MTDTQIKTNRDDQVTEAMLAFGMLTTELVLRFLEQRGAKPQCPTCDTNDWEITRPDADGATYLSLQPGGHRMPASSHVPALLMVCRNCAHIRHVAALPIMQWAAREAGHE